MDFDLVDSFFSYMPEKKKRGRPKKYSDALILKLWLIMHLCRLDGETHLIRHVKCYVDGKLEIDMDDDNNPFKKGAIGVGTFNAEGHFDDVIVDGKGIPPSPVSPKGMLTETLGHIKDRY